MEKKIDNIYSFWKLKEWSQFWPEESQERIALDFSNSPLKDRYERYCNILDVMNGVKNKTTTLYEAQNFANSISNMVNDYNFTKCLTLPPSAEGFEKAIQVYITDINPFPALIMAVIRPNEFLNALNNLDKESVNENFKTIKKLEKLAKNTPKPNTFIPSKIKEESEKFINLLEKTNNSNAHESVKKEEWNGFIKNEVSKHKGHSEHATNYWFEDIAFPALCLLKLEQLEQILQLWPHHSLVSFNNPSLTMQSPAFWKSIRNLRYPERPFILETLLPKLVDTTDWSAEEKIKMLPFMVEKTQKYDWLFEERIKLWINWGGDLDLEMPIIDNKSSSIFSINTQSAREWLSQSNENWKQVLDTKFKPSSTTSTFSPK